MRAVALSITSIWITSGRIRPLWFSHCLRGSNTQLSTCAHNCTLLTNRLLRHVWFCFPCEPFQRKPRRLQRGLLAPLFSSLLPPSPLAAAGLWLVTDPPAPACVCECVFVCTRFSAILSCPTSAQIRASVSVGRKKYKNKAFCQNTDLNTHTHTQHPCIMKAYSEWGTEGPSSTVQIWQTDRLTQPLMKTALRLPACNRSLPPPFLVLQLDRLSLLHALKR